MLGLRVTPEHKERLDAAAASSGRSQSQEAESRIEFSFDREDLLTDVLRLAYGRRVAGILQLLGSAMLHSGVNALLSAAGGPLADDGKADFTGWTEDPDAYEQAKRSVVAILDRLRPEGQISNPHGTTGQHVAEDILGTLGGNPADEDGYRRMPIYSWDPADINRLLGPIASRAAKSAPAEQCCSWCKQSLFPGQAEAIVARIGAWMLESNVSELTGIVLPSLDASVCSLCEQPIPPDKVDEIMDRAAHMIACMEKHRQEIGLGAPESERAVLDFQAERAKRLKAYGT
jgi:hypothetical protein